MGAEATSPAAGNRLAPTAAAGAGAVRPRGAVLASLGRVELEPPRADSSRRHRALGRA